MSHSYLFKVLTAGDGAVGKTTLLRRFVDGKFSEGVQMTLGVEFFTKELTIGNTKVMLQLWDFGGQEHFRFMLSKYALGAKGALIMFDLTRMLTLQSIDEWVNICKNDPRMSVLLIGTKLDLEDAITVSDETAKELIEKYNFVDYIKVSSKTGKNVNDIFEKLAKLILKREGL